MRISTKGRYSMRLMLDLAENNTGQPVSLRDISARQGISEKYLEQIIAALNRGGCVRSVRGAQGGYLLSRKPEEYTVGEILRVTEGDLSPVECVGYNKTECDREDDCAIIRVWQKINDAVNAVVDSITLKDLLDWSHEKCRTSDK